MQNNPAETPENRLTRLFGSPDDLAAIAFEDARTETLAALQPIIGRIALQAADANATSGPVDAKVLARSVATTVEVLLTPFLTAPSQVGR